MKNYKIIISYDGTRYSGWQVQKDVPDTVQGKIENVLTLLFEEPIEISGSGRTDAGVHAYGQVANFHISEDSIQRLMGSYTQKTGFQDERLAKKPTIEELIHFDLNTHLPKDIAILSVTEVDERFHARLSAKKKTYCYRIHTGFVSNVFERKFVYDYPIPLNIDAMREAAEFLLGEHDFKSFCGNRHMKKSTVRTIYSIEIAQKEDEIILSFTGNGFLMNMVRILTGTLIEVGDGRRTPSSMADILEAKNRDAAGYTAPPQGLYLKEVFYE